jgi:hypothetical protein
MNMEQYHLGEGDRHRDTRTYGNTQNAEFALPPRSELAAGILKERQLAKKMADIILVSENRSRYV